MLNEIEIRIGEIGLSAWGYRTFPSNTLLSEVKEKITQDFGEDGYEKAYLFKDWRFINFDDYGISIYNPTISPDKQRYPIDRLYLKNFNKDIPENLYSSTLAEYLEYLYRAYGMPKESFNSVNIKEIPIGEKTTILDLSFK